ncbi:hypothetical protein VTN00DRAFT_4094 [Thermoascus crustaceus]|uniref:uncharacterized protein n=1 Tax=Thermoascus crustaceus TaxID=5088 RepID=UPI0037436519
MALPRASLFRTIFTSQSARTAGARASSRVSSQWRQLGRRTYADQAGQGPTPKQSDLPWAITSVAITIPAAALLLNSGPEKHPHGHIGEEHHSPEEIKAAEAAKEPAPEEPKPEEAPPAPEAKPEEEVTMPRVHEYERVERKPPEADPTAGMRQVGGPNVASSAQENVANADTSNPFLASPGKSEKSEGVTETARYKGSIDPNRPAH